MSRVAQPAEKVLALAGIYRALASELDDRIDDSDPRVQVALLHVSSDIAMRTETRDMGLLAYEGRLDPINVPCDDCGEVGGTHNPLVEH